MYVAFIISRGSISRESISRGETCGTPWLPLGGRCDRRTNKQTDRQTNRCTLPLRKAPLRQRLNNKQIGSKGEKCLIKIHFKNGVSQHGFYVPGAIFCLISIINVHLTELLYEHVI